MSMLSRCVYLPGTQRRRPGAPADPRPRPPRRKFLLCLFLFLGLGLDLGACSTPLPPLPPLPSLHLPGVVQLDAVVALESKTGDDQIRSILTYQRPRESVSDPQPATPPATMMATHVLYLGGGALYTIHLDGSGLHRIEISTPCYFLGGLDPTGLHGVCWSDQGVQAFTLDEGTTSLTIRMLVPSNYAPQRDVLTDPTLAPDGQHLAALEDVGVGAPASIVIYAVDPSLTTAERVATISLPGMHARRLSWSSDGRWLAVASDDSTATTVAGATYALPLASVLPRLPAFPGQARQPLTLMVDRAQLIHLEDGLDLTNAWRPMGTSATWTYTSGATVWQLDLSTGQRTALLTIPEGAICAIAWTRDGRQLVFAQCRLGSTEQLPPPACLYVYTLPT